MPAQSNWQWCKKCQGLFFGGNNTLGVCPAGGAHDNSSSGDYFLTQDSGSGQSDWQWCNRCQGLFFAGNNTLGVCPVGGAHNNNGSGNYFLTQGSGSGQSNWQWCNRCQGLFFAGNNTLGVCPAGGAHNNNGSGDYFLTQGVNSITVKHQVNMGGPEGGNIAGPVAVTIEPDGSYNFTGRMNNSNPLPNNVGVVVAIWSRSGHVFTFAQSGSIGPNVPFFNNNWDWQNNGSNSAIAAGWSDLGSGYSAQVAASATLDLNSLWNGIKSAIQAIGPIVQVVGAIAAIAA